MSARLASRESSKHRSTEGKHRDPFYRRYLPQNTRREKYYTRVQAQIDQIELNFAIFRS